LKQGSQEWHSVRCGRFTGSRFGDLMASTRSGPSASRKALLATLAVERLTGQTVETYQNDAMRRGSELEAEARERYAFLTDSTVRQLAFIVHRELDYCGVSPDGLVGKDGLVEIKCPSNMAKHVDALRSGAHATEYKWQIQGQMWVTERRWCDAVSYDPRFPEELQVAITRVERDDKAIKELEAAVIAANEEVAGMVAELQQLRTAA
jgi:putative phage-type endonuclease